MDKSWIEKLDIEYKDTRFVELDIEERSKNIGYLMAREFLEEFEKELIKLRDELF